MECDKWQIKCLEKVNVAVMWRLKYSISLGHSVKRVSTLIREFYSI